MRVPIFAAASLLVSAALVTAQTDRITIRLSPAPNQTVRQRMLMQVDINMANEPAATSMPFTAPQHVEMKMTTEVTSAVGPTDARGHYDSRVTVDAATWTASMNGQPMPMPSSPEQAIGTSFIIHLDDQGKMIDADVNGAPQSAAGAVKQMLTGLMAATEPITLSIGETITQPRVMSLPMPGAGSTGGMAMTGETRYTLTSITFDGADRIAHLAVGITANVGATVAPPAAASMTTETRTAGEGTIDVNVERGIVLHNELRMTTDTSMRSQGSPMLPSMQSHGTMTLSVDVIK